MSEREIPPREAAAAEEDAKALASLGYAQELLRRMSGFSNFAISLSIICILAGGVTSFPQGFLSVGGAAIGLGWPVGCIFSLIVALAMAQVASAFPTAGGLYHWASILGGRGWGWLTAWFNLAGLVTVLAAINVGTHDFLAGAFGPYLGPLDPLKAPEGTRLVVQAALVTLITLSQAYFNHRGIRLTSILTDLSGWLILAVAAALTIALLASAGSFEPARLWTFTNFSGLPPGDPVWPRVESLPWLFALGLLLPAYTVTGFDASAHVSEETIGAARNVPRGIIRSVAVSALFGWAMLAAVLLAMPDLSAAAAQGKQVFYWTLRSALSDWIYLPLCVGIAVVNYLCGLATVTSASRMLYAFARDGGLPFHGALRRVSAAHRVPAVAIWTVAILAVLFSIYSPVYSTITAACVIFLYLSYVIPIALGFFAYGRAWTRMGPFDLGRLYRPCAIAASLGCLLLIAIGVAPPNQLAGEVAGGTTLLLALVWFLAARLRFEGPPVRGLRDVGKEERR